MNTPRARWRNYALSSDAEIRDIDAMEDRLAPIVPGAERVRDLISCFELCHHKAARWARNIVEAIGRGDTEKGLGTRPAGLKHPAESVWQDAIAVLSAWCAGTPAQMQSVGGASTDRLLSGPGARTPLRVWQVQRVVEKIGSVLPASEESPPAGYEWLLLGGGPYEAGYRTTCPTSHREHEGFWRATVRTIIRDTDHGNEAALSLALAIDMLWPCHWAFVDNLQVVLDAIGGRLTPNLPFAACGRNIRLTPLRTHWATLGRTLRTYSGATEGGEVYREMLELLGPPSPEKRWLAASLEKTIRLQLDPPADLQATSSLAGPDWVFAEDASIHQAP